MVPNRTVNMHLRRLLNSAAGPKRRCGVRLLNMNVVPPDSTHGFLLHRCHLPLFLMSKKRMFDIFPTPQEHNKAPYPWFWTVRSIAGGSYADMSYGATIEKAGK